MASKQELFENKKINNLNKQHKMSRCFVCFLLLIALAAVAGALHTFSNQASIHRDKRSSSKCFFANPIAFRPRNKTKNLLNSSTISSRTITHAIGSTKSDEFVSMNRTTTAGPVARLLKGCRKGVNLIGVTLSAALVTILFGDALSSFSRIYS